MAKLQPTAEIPPDLLPAWQQLACGFAAVAEVFPDCMRAAQRTLTPAGLDAYLDYARSLGKLGRGPEPMLTFLEAWPEIASHVGEAALPAVMDVVQRMQKSPNGRAIAPFLQALPTAARRLQSLQALGQYLALVLDLMAHTTGSIHGKHDTFPSPGLPEMFKQLPVLLGQLSLSGLKNWVDYGVRHYRDHPERQVDYFSLQSPDSRAVFQRERHGTLLMDHERRLSCYLRALWRDDDVLVPYSEAFDTLRKPIPYYDALGLRLPDAYDELNGVSGLDRYRAALAHMAAHRRWSQPVVADNLSPFQRVAVEFFEDIRVDFLAMRLYPGLRPVFLALHPVPIEDACDPNQQSAVRHRLAMVSRGVLDPLCRYRDADINACVAQLNAQLSAGESSTREMVDAAITFIARTRRQSDLSPKVYFDNTVVSYRDDNRHLWLFIEEGDEEEAFDKPERSPEEPIQGLPPRHYPEWDYGTQSYRPDWVSVYEHLHPSGHAAHIDHLLHKHAGLAKQLKRVLDGLKPQDKVRIRYQEDGSELDLDVALRALLEAKAGVTPDPRITLRHTRNGRSVAVLLLLDLSESLTQAVGTDGQTLLELSQEAVALLAWAVDQLGDPLAIAGFRSNTRHDVRYLHIKGFRERWDDTVKARFAAIEAGWSTRMGAAMRHGAHYLGRQNADKKLMLILTDGEPADVDSKDSRLLIEDARRAVIEIEQQGIYPYCINLDPGGDPYVRDIFGKQFSIIDNVSRLPHKLPELFIALTR
ncbi:MAG: hypothetical protein OHK0048_12430 [Rhodoferax sp.]